MNLTINNKSNNNNSNENYTNNNKIIQIISISISIVNYTIQ